MSTVAKSQNGWPVNPPRRSRLVDGTPDVRVTVADGPAGDVLMHVLAQFHARVEPLTLDGARGEFDDWGYAERNVRGSDEISNHASATAVDVNATRHPLGAVHTFTSLQVARIHDILAEVDHVVRWGGDYTGRRDEMHFEINADAAAVARVANRLATQEEHDMSVKFVKGNSTVREPGGNPWGPAWGDRVYKIEYTGAFPTIAVRTPVPNPQEPGYRAWLALGGKVETIAQAVLDAIPTKQIR